MLVSSRGLSISGGGRRLTRLGDEDGSKDPDCVAGEFGGC